MISENKRKSVEGISYKRRRNFQDFLVSQMKQVIARGQVEKIRR